MKYGKFLYYYPPRPENKITPESLDYYDDGNFITQPKSNGSCCMLYLNENFVKIYDRHKKEKSWLVDGEKVYRGNDWMILCGEWMNKGKFKDKKKWNDKLVIWDILVYQGEYLTGTTYPERIKLLDEIYGTESYDDYFYKISDDFYRVKTFYKNFKKTFDEIKDIYPDGNGLLEGLVLKMKKGKLKKGINSKNNVLTQLKTRIPTKNYAF
jgi:hypothetical protein